jgi:hypothetical protein
VRRARERKRAPTVVTALQPLILGPGSGDDEEAPVRKYCWLAIVTPRLIIVVAGVGGFLLGDVRAGSGISVMRATPHAGETFTVLTVGQAAKRLPAGWSVENANGPVFGEARAGYSSWRRAPTDGA